MGALFGGETGERGTSVGLGQANLDAPVEVEVPPSLAHETGGGDATRDLGRAGEQREELLGGLGRTLSGKQREPGERAQILHRDDLAFFVDELHARAVALAPEGERAMLLEDGVERVGKLAADGGRPDPR